MDYIIHPAVFYWIHAIDCLRTAVIFLFAMSFVASGILLGAVVGDWCYDDEDTQKCRVWFRRCVWMTVIGLLIIVFVPSKNTMIEMLIARYATRSNAEVGIEGIKSLVDYIVQALKTAK